MELLTSELKKKRLLDFTGEELVALFSECGLAGITDTTIPTPQQQTPKHVFGIEGLATLLNCGKTTAQKIKNSGKLNGCFYMVGHKLIFDADAVLKQFAVH